MRNNQGILDVRNQYIAYDTIYDVYWLFIWFIDAYCPRKYKNSPKNPFWPKPSLVPVEPRYLSFCNPVKLDISTTVNHCNPGILAIKIVMVRNKGRRLLHMEAYIEAAKWPAKNGYRIMIENLIKIMFKLLEP